MDTPETATVEVTQADRDEAADYLRDHGYWHVDDEEFRSGAKDGTPLVQAFARHRTRATRQDGLREAMRSIVEGEKAHWLKEALKHKRPSGRRSDCAVRDLERARIAQRILDKIDAALDSSKTESGSDEALKEQEFNRGVLIAVSTLINCWGRGTETEHLLAMIDATPEMVEQMGFDNYDREPLLAALSASPEGEGK